MSQNNNFAYNEALNRKPTFWRRVCNEMNVNSWMVLKF